ncbi:MAG: VWA domain-containing protein, partial [Candidatus Aminicenantes bacterium]|nr:VWA domain-containing protein [Candidatus Aminicenantes bacterium]
MMSLTREKEKGRINMSYRKRKIIAMLCFMASLAVALTAQGTTGAGGFDFIVIVDQSGSMSGFAGKPSDKLGVRNDMVKRAFDLVAQNGRLNTKIHRFGVISFGSTIRIDLPLSRITSNTIDSLRERLNQSLIDKNLVYTDFLSAFKAAQNMFLSPPQAEKGNRVILLITDGAPYVDGFYIYKYKDDLKRFIAASFPHPDYKLHVVALNDPASNYWDDYREFWKDLSHNQARKLENNEKEIFNALQEEVNKILGSTPGELVIDNPVLPPYLESVVFDIFRIDPVVTVRIYPANNPKEALFPKAPDVIFVDVGRTIQTITVKKPHPGLWRIEKSDKDAQVNIYMQRILIHGTLLKPNSKLPIKLLEKIMFKYLVEDDDHKLLQEIPGYPL